MRIDKCPSCAGTVTYYEESKNYICDYCDSIIKATRYTSNRKKLADENFLEQRFDAAARHYSSVIEESEEDAEAYWGLVMCEYGVSFVDDPKSGKRIPTCNRTTTESIFEDKNYKKAIEYSDFVTREQYKNWAIIINDVQKEILNIARKEKPYDIFICYKESEDITGEQTKESTAAERLYHQLDKEGYRTFYAPITLRDKAGEKYEPIVFSAIKTAKVMFVICYTNEHFEAPWVRNEWKRFLDLKNKGKECSIIPCYNSYIMSGNAALPKELSALQALDMSNMDVYSLANMVKTQLLPRKQQSATIKYTISDEKLSSVASLCKRGYIYLEDGEFSGANNCFERCLEQHTEFSRAYWGKLLVKNRCKNNDGLIEIGKPIDEDINYKRAYQYGSSEERGEYKNASDAIYDRIARTVEQLKNMRKQYIQNVETALDAEREAMKELQNAANQYMAEYDSNTKKLREKQGIWMQKLEPYRTKNDMYRKNLSNALSDAKQKYSYSKKEAKSLTAWIEEKRREIDSIKGDIKDLCANDNEYIEIRNLNIKQSEVVKNLTRIDESAAVINENIKNIRVKLEAQMTQFDTALSQVANGDYSVANSILA